MDERRLPRAPPAWWRTDAPTFWQKLLVMQAVDEGRAFVFAIGGGVLVAALDGWAPLGALSMLALSLLLDWREQLRQRGWHPRSKDWHP